MCRRTFWKDPTSELKIFSSASSGRGNLHRDREVRYALSLVLRHSFFYLKGL